MSEPAQTRRRRAPKPKPAEERVLSVRMYDVGFGDCFLVRIPTPEGKARKILFDCGSIKQGGRPLKDVVRQVIDDARDAPEGPAHIDVVVATHRHRDHISGFSDPAWAAVEVGEVWLPWTEKPDDPHARKIQEDQHRLAEQLEKRLTLRLASAGGDAILRASLESGRQMALNALTNEAAMRTLYRGFAGEPKHRYLPEEAATTSWFDIPHLPGVTIHVLGPPRDETIIRDLDPPVWQSYLRYAEASEGVPSERPRPFREDWELKLAEYESDYPLLWQALQPWEREAVCKAGNSLDQAVAAALDKALNGTSLMLVLQVGTATLLFPGDAQWGTWRLALENPDWRKLLGAVTFCKVGHHGSHNATPVEFVENVLGGNFWAMVSTTSMANWPKIPKQELVDSLRQKSGAKVVLSSCPEEASASGFSVEEDGVIEVRIPFEVT